LVLMNGAIIEHAREGFTNWRPQDWNSIGGVIQVQGTPNEVGATLLNNRRSAGFMAYQNFHPNNPSILRPNTSYFKYAHFKVDGDYRGGYDFHDHVSMWKTDGIQFRACTFENAQTTVPVSTQLGRGIFSIDANYTVGGNCTVTFPNCCPPCPPENLDKGAFIGLDHGIDARDGGSGRGFTVQDCRFENNVVGVYTEGLSTFTVAKNEFILGDRDVVMDGVVDANFQEFHHRGVSTQRSHGFRIEENIFNRSANTTAEGVTAIVIENSRENNTQVYKNQAFDMDEGYIGEGNCIDGFQASSIGHQFLCNTNTSNGNNFLVRKDDDGTATWNHSIRTQQGSDPSPAGNLFDQETGVVDESDYKNETAWVINYWHAGGQSEPMDFTPGWFGKALATGTNGCPSKLSGKEVKMTPGLQEQVAGELQAAKAAYISTAYVFNSLLDGGNTDAVIEEVQQSWPSEAWELRQYLLSKSPYLSTEVLKEMMLKNTLPQAMVLEICLANPEATKKEGFTKWAEFEVPNPLPSYMIDLIAGSWAPKTFRMQLEEQMGQHHANMSAAADILQDALRSDEEQVHPAEAIVVWQQLPNYGARYGEVAARLRLNDFDGARSVLNNLASTYPMKADREVERDRALWYVDKLEALHGSGREVPQLTEAEVTEWQTFALAAGDIPGTWAGNVLCFFHEVCFGRGGGPTTGNKSLRPTVQNPTTTAQPPALALLPNPASAWVTLAHELTSPVINAYARILDANGRQVASLTIAAARGQQVWDTREVPAGIYTVEFFNNGQRVETKRLVVQPQN
ncbi:MAG TPA: T9SS type A sorting domain-containing protein, partial [Flavobacteriales bacterium]|nr:T9SS type A sorting domain-containing protein [Flavobacteriales bacterium]